MGTELGVGVRIASNKAIGFSVTYNPNESTDAFTGDPTMRAFAEAQVQVGALRGTVGLQSTESQASPGTFEAPAFFSRFCTGPACVDQSGATLRFSPKSLAEQMFGQESATGAKFQAKAGVELMTPIYSDRPPPEPGAIQPIDFEAMRARRIALRASALPEFVWPGPGTPNALPIFPEHVP